MGFWQKSWCSYHQGSNGILKHNTQNPIWPQPAASASITQIQADSKVTAVFHCFLSLFLFFWICNTEENDPIFNKIVFLCSWIKNKFGYSCIYTKATLNKEQVSSKSNCSFECTRHAQPQQAFWQEYKGIRVEERHAECKIHMRLSSVTSHEAFGRPQCQQII